MGPACASELSATAVAGGWRTEKDPAVRAVVAEAIYQSNPQDYFGARALLDSFAATDVVYGRLRTLAQALKVDVPGVGSVVELAAEGNQEAILRVFDLAVSAKGDSDAEEELAGSLSEIARTAPDELVGALKAAPAPEREAAQGLLAQGLARASDAKHPFWPSLRRLMASSDTELAAFAKSLDGALSQTIARLKAPPKASETAIVQATPASAPATVAAQPAKAVESKDAPDPKSSVQPAKATVSGQAQAPTTATLGPSPTDPTADSRPGG